MSTSFNSIMQPPYAGIRGVFVSPPEPTKKSCSLVVFGALELIFSLAIVGWAVWLLTTTNNYAPYVAIGCGALYFIIAILAMVGGNNTVRNRCELISCLILTLIAIPFAAMVAVGAGCFMTEARDKCNKPECLAKTGIDAVLDTFKPEMTKYTKYLGLCPGFCENFDLIFYPLIAFPILAGIFALIVSCLLCGPICCNRPTSQGYVLQQNPTFPLGPTDDRLHLPSYEQQAASDVQYNPNQHNLV